MIKLLTSMAGPDFSYAPGEIITIDAETEKRLIETGQAEKVTKKPTKKKSIKA